MYKGDSQLVQVSIRSNFFIGEITGVECTGVLRRGCLHWERHLTTTSKPDFHQWESGFTFKGRLMMKLCRISNIRVDKIDDSSCMVNGSCHNETDKSQSKFRIPYCGCTPADHLLR